MNRRRAMEIVVEKKIAERIIDGLFADGYLVGVHDSAEITVPPCDDRARIVAALMTTDDDRLLVAKKDAPSKIFGWVWLIYGNNFDIVGDYTTNLEHVMDPVNTFVDELEAEEKGVGDGGGEGAHAARVCGVQP